MDGTGSTTSSSGGGLGSSSSGGLGSSSNASSSTSTRRLKKRAEELRCPQCGHVQNPAMRHLYRYCYRCRREVTPSAALQVSALLSDHGVCVSISTQMRTAFLQQEASQRKRKPLLVLAAAYGHITDPFKALDITGQSHLVSRSNDRNELFSSFPQMNCGV
jgi:hypothetical protein